MTEPGAHGGNDVLRIRAVALTHRGCVRANNQDAIAVGGWIRQTDMTQPAVISLEVPRGRPSAFVVADGLGGHPAGEVASQLVVERIASRVANAGPDPCAAAHTLAIDANQHVYDRMSAPPGRPGMGSTVAGLLVSDGQCAIFNVGDSRVYRLQDGYLHQLSVDDGAPGFHGVLQCLGGAPSFVPVTPHVRAERWLPGRRYLLCSDGLSMLLPLDAIEDALARPVERAVEVLLEAALAAGAPDNVSILLLERE